MPSGGVPEAVGAGNCAQARRAGRGALVAKGRGREKMKSAGGQSALVSACGVPDPATARASKPPALAGSAAGANQLRQSNRN